MKYLNLIIDAVLLYLFIYFVAPILIKEYESLGATLPIATAFFLAVCDFWRSFFYSPIFLYLGFSLLVITVIPTFKNDKYSTVFRVPFLISLIGSMTFLSIPLLPSIN